MDDKPMWQDAIIPLEGNHPLQHEEFKLNKALSAPGIISVWYASTEGNKVGAQIDWAPRFGREQGFSIILTTSEIDQLIKRLTKVRGA